ncbi:MAG TPA: restriction endonuclease subunit S [Clostridiaceae bacterium]|jgi:type I restriction enzyme S subunit|nr:restriction endonuclease subunit S [Clostridiaceae bacterium]
MSKYRRYERYKDSGIEWIGEIPEEWEVVKIKHLTRVKRGASPRPIDDPIYFDDDGEYSWVRISDVTASKMYLNESTEKLSALGASLSVKLNPDQLFISICATVGKPCITKIKCCIHDGFVYFPDFKGDNRFLYYIFEAGEAYKGLGKLGTQLNLNTDIVGGITIGFPHMNEQKAIANFLDQKTAEIDDLIADKEKLVELLQEKRQVVISEAVTKGLNPNVKMKDSGVEWIGEMPEHWEVNRIKYLATVNPNKSEVRYLPSEQKVTFIPMDKIIATGKVDYALTNTMENLINNYTYFRNEDIIMAKVTPCFENGNIAIVKGLLNGIGFGTTELHVLRCNNKCYNRFLFYYLQSDIFKSKGISEMYGVAGLKRIPTDFILNYKLGIPDYQEQEQIANYLDKKTSQIDELTYSIQLQIKKLKEYRQSLISEAVTGKIKVL